MKIKSLIFLLPICLGLHCQIGLQAQIMQPSDTTLILTDSLARDSFWIRTDKGIFFDDGYVGINTSKPQFFLDVDGEAGVRRLWITDQYSLPDTHATDKHFLNGLGEWAVPAGGGGGGDCYWEGGLGKGIFFNKGNVGIGTPYNNANAKLQVVGNMNVGENPHAIIGKNAFVGGVNSIASGQNSFAYGDQAKATNSSAFAIGLKSEANGTFSVAMGRESTAGNINSIALGYVARANGINSIAIGKHIDASAGNAYLLGSGLGLGTNMLVNNIEYSLMIGFKSTVPTFFVSSSNGAGTTGSIGIGNMTDPQAKLHILSDLDKPATLKLEHRTTGKDRYAEIGLGTHSIRAGNTANMVFKTPTTSRHFVFENGNVGIGTADPTSVLHIHRDEEPVLKLSNNQGNLIMAVVNTPWHYAPTSQAGDVVFKTHYVGNRHGMIFNMNNEFNDGNSYIKFNDNYNHHTLTIFNNGKVGVGTSNPQAELDVHGTTKIRGNLYAEEVIVEEAANWPDYVFEADYQLMDLGDLKSFIDTNKHLPGTPKADEDGKVQNLKLSEMNALLLKKIEELTLYILEQEERIKRLEGAKGE